MAWFAEGGRFNLRYIISLFISCVRIRRVLRDNLSGTWRIREGCGTLKIMLSWEYSILGT